MGDNRRDTQLKPPGHDFIIRSLPILDDPKVKMIQPIPSEPCSVAYHECSSLLLFLGFCQ